MATKKERFIIIDGNALVHRAFHALPPTISTKNGQTVNAVYGFTTIMLKVLRELKPDYLAVAFDLEGPTFRHQKYQAYKATRQKQPDELYQQLPIVKEVLAAFHIPIYEKKGFEADDVIATMVKNKAVEKLQSLVVTGDLDTLQLVDENTHVYTMHKGISDTITYDVAEVKRRFDGLTPNQMVDFKALKGDPSDNIPGVRGIGEKGAITLLKEFNTLKNLYQNLSSPKIKERYQRLLQEHKKEALLSQKLAQMVDNVPIKFDLQQTAVRSFDVGTVVPLFQKLEFKSLISKLPKELQTGQAPGQGMLEFVKESRNQEVKKSRSQFDYRLVDTEKKFEEFLEKLKKQKLFALDTETSGLDPFSSKLLGISFSWKAGAAYYMVAQKPWLKNLASVLENEKIKKVGHNIKFDLEVLAAAGISLKGILFDTMIASYLINPGGRQHNLDGLVFTELGHQMQPISELIGGGKNQISMKDVPLEKIAPYACEDADYTYRLLAPLKKQLEEKENRGLLEKIELPLVPVLATMEAHGVLLDTKILGGLAQKTKHQTKKLEETVYRLAKTKFNVASPLQLKAVLFDKLGISTEGLGKTKTGISTAAAELEKLQGKHKIIDHIIKHRELSKLLSTYLEALPKLTDKNGRVHTSFNQTVTATGRLSSSDPNLQNIPVRTELGRQIRKAFVAPRGYLILSADYSQIELRIIASLANDAKMITSFKKGEDIHARTAAEINGVSLENVTKEMRYAAKAINFGIIYGQGPVGLSQNSGISRQEAARFIEKYFSIHQNIKKYLETTKELARKNCFVETFFGRRRYLPEINSSIQQVRAGSERAAINHPIQGTAADMIKLAMIEIHQKLPGVSPQAKMILQVHDELVFEVPATDIKQVAKLVEQEMESVYTLRAPIETHVSVGDNWGELEKI